MMFARLAIGALATFATGFVTAVVARRSTVLLLVVLIQQHIIVWDKFPVSYHLLFLVSLVPLTYVGGKIADGQSRGSGRS
jgi:hypothetical protein